MTRSCTYNHYRSNRDTSSGLFRRHCTSTCRVVQQTATSLRLSAYAEAGWLRGTVVEDRSVTGELSLPYARPAVDG